MGSRSRKASMRCPALPTAARARRRFLPSVARGPSRSTTPPPACRFPATHPRFAHQLRLSRAARLHSAAQPAGHGAELPVRHLHPAEHGQPRRAREPQPHHARPHLRGVQVAAAPLRDRADLRLPRRDRRPRHELQHRLDAQPAQSFINRCASISAATAAASSRSSPTAPTWPASSASRARPATRSTAGRRISPSPTSAGSPTPAPSLRRDQTAGVNEDVPC